MANKLKQICIDSTCRTVDLYKAGTNISFGEAGADGLIPINSTVDTSNFATQQDLQELDDAKQDVLSAGDNIQINGSSISATDTTYTAGTNVQISQDNVISATDTTYTAGANVTIANGVISATDTDTTYSAGDNISISAQNVISADLSDYYTQTEVNNLIGSLTSARIEVVQSLPATGEENVIYLVPKSPAGESGNIYDEYVYANNNFELIGDTDIDLSDYVTTTQMNTALAGKQDTLTAGNNIAIENGVISATDTTYTAGSGISITNNEISTNLTKNDILTALGYEEIEMSMTDDAGTVNTWTVLAQIEA